MINKENIQHVIPVDDIMPHTEFCFFIEGQLPVCDCLCKPEHKEIKEPSGIGECATVALIIVHNSFDGREGIEWANEVLSPQLCYKTGKPCKCEGLCRDDY